MEETIKILTENSILVVIAGVFLYTYLTDKKSNATRDCKYTESLGLLSKSNDNIAKSLDLLTRSMDENKELLSKHDERSIKINENVNINSLKIDECKEIVKNCKKVGKE